VGSSRGFFSPVPKPGGITPQSDLGGEAHPHTHSLHAATFLAALSGARHAVVSALLLSLVGLEGPCLSSRPQTMQNL
jgi:hypothetical protein